MYGYKACPGCGAAVQRSLLESDEHRCAPERFVAHQTRQARPGLDQLEEDLASWLATPQGAFQAYLAERSVTASGSSSSVS
jgi:hypothetical protein